MMKFASGWRRFRHDPEAAMSKRREPDYSDVQGLARFGHNQLREACFLLLAIANREQARAWLRNAPVTSAERVTPPPATALQIAFTSEGLRNLELDEHVLEGFSEEFIVGMANDNARSRRLGDIAHNATENWDWGTAESMPHVLVMAYAETGKLGSWRETLQDSVFEQAFEIVAELDTVDTDNIEPFGFADGISQPAIDWKGKQTSNLHRRDRYSNLLSLGEILLGYRNEYGQYTRRPLLDGAVEERARLLPEAEDNPQLNDLGRNGSYLVMRQLHQKVPEFWQFIDQQVDGDPQRREQLASRMVGRQRDGTPVVAEATQAIEGITGEGGRAGLNHFTFDDDPHGQQCPIAAHIRRSNPRTGDFPPGVSGIWTRLVRILGFGREYPGDDVIASTRFHRLLRRGRVYGEQLSPGQALDPDASQEPRGLHFICLVANISRQFEFVQNAWSMGPKFGGLQNETDPLLGNRQPLADGETTNHFSLPDARGPARCIHDMPPFVTVQGGAYFFMPGIRALHYLAGAEAAEDNSE